MIDAENNQHDSEECTTSGYEPVEGSEKFTAMTFRNRKRTGDDERSARYRQNLEGICPASQRSSVIGNLKWNMPYDQQQQ